MDADGRGLSVAIPLATVASLYVSASTFAPEPPNAGGSLGSNVIVVRMTISSLPIGQRSDRL